MQSVLREYWLVAVLGGLPILLAILLQILSQRMPWRDRLVKALTGVVAPYFVSLGLLFGLFAAFLGNDVWGRLQAQATRLEASVQREAGALRLLDALARATGESGRSMTILVREYARLTLAEELIPFRHRRSRRAQEAFHDLARAIAGTSSAFAARRVVQAAMLNAVADIELARSERFLVTGEHNHPIIWIAVMALGFLTQIALVVVHISARSAQAAALGLFTAGFSLTMVILTISDVQLSEPPSIARDVFAPVYGGPASGTTLGP